MVFVDVGANLGYLSLVAARAVGAGGKVICFEPNQMNCGLLYISAKANGFENIEIHPFAVTDTCKSVIYDDINGNGVISEVGAEFAFLPTRYIAMAVTLDHALRDEKQVHVIKMDVEGAEYLVLQGARKLLAAHRPTILSELSPGGLANVSKVSDRDYIQMLVGEGYDISVLREDGDVADCGTDVSKALNHVHQRRESHIDIMALPR
ncbi:MAG: FkbM family methyltransferase [Acidobacteriota bacterium]|nr:FkbM family methyltransferase [Acidobacteriota bacterium]